MLSWKSPGGDIVDYVVEYTISASGATWYTYNDGVSTATTATITGFVTEGTGMYRVRTENSAGELSYPSPPVMIDGSADTPSSPTHLTFTPDEHVIDLSWDAPNDAGGSPVTDYVVQFRSADTVSWTTWNDGVGTSTSTTITGRSSGFNYDVRVYAVNAQGNSIPVTARSKVPWSGSSAPATGLTAVAGDTSVELSWDAPPSGSPTYYVSWAYAGSSTWTSHGTTSAQQYTVTGLQSGTEYQFRVGAKLGSQAATYSVISGIATNTVDFPPDAPTITVATAPASTAAAVAWSDGASAGTSPVTGYRVLLASGGGPFTEAATTDATSSSAVLAGLTPSTTYDVRVVAFSAVGDSAPSTTSSFTTPAAGTGPAAPQNLSAVANDGQVTLSWSAVSGADSYMAVYRAPGGQWAYFPVFDTTTTVTGLTNGVTYEFQVMAASGSTGGDPSSISATPRVIGPASAPGTVSATGKNGYVRLQWDAPTDDGGRPITDYVVRHRLAATSAWETTTIANPSATFTTVYGLTNGSEYEFEIAARTSYGEGTPAAVTGTPLRTPGAPQAFQASGADSQVTLTWEEPDEAEQAGIDGYSLYYQEDFGPEQLVPGSPFPASARSFTLTGLTNGTEYYFRVTAVNANGEGYMSSASATPRAVPIAPTAPQSLSSDSGDASASLTWEAPTDNGGAPITDYVVQYQVTGASSWTTFADGVSATMGTTVDGLTNGTEYVFRVAAVTSAGQGPWSFTGTTPAGLAAAPVVRATTTSGEVTLTWAPVDGNGSLVLAYFIEVYDDRFGWIGATAFDAPASGDVSHTFTGLTDGETMTYRVSTFTDRSPGLVSEPVSVVVGATGQEPHGPSQPGAGGETSGGQGAAPGGGETLALTGASLLAGSAGAVMLLLAGGLSLWWSRRRIQAAEASRETA